MGESQRPRQQRDTCGWCLIQVTDQVESVDEAFFLQLQEVSWLQALVLLGEFNHTHICWKSSMVSYRQSRRLLEHTEDKFLSQVIDNSTRGCCAGPVACQHKWSGWWLRIGVCLSYSDHAMVELRLLKDIRQAKSKIRKINFRKAN